MMTIKSPLVSVIIPTYNRAWCIGRAINSVLNQTYQNFEIVITDDGSNDNTHEVIEAFADPRIKYYKFLNNKGVIEARHNCILNSKGEWILLIDSDDEINNNCLETFLNEINTLNDKNVRVFFADLIDSSTHKTTGNRYLFERKNPLAYEDIICGKFLGDYLPLVKKELFAESPYYTTQKRMMPLIWHKMFRHSDVYFIGEVLGVCHTDSHDRITGNRVKDAELWVDGIKEYITEFSGDIILHCPKHLGFTYRILAIYQLAAGYRRDGLGSIVRSLSNNIVDWKSWAVLFSCLLPRRCVIRMLVK